MKNKLLASILTACMLLTMLPTAAFAAETEAESGTEQTATATEQSDPVTEDAGNQTEADERMRGMPLRARLLKTLWPKLVVSITPLWLKPLKPLRVARR